MNVFMDTRLVFCLFLCFCVFVSDKHNKNSNTVDVEIILSDIGHGSHGRGVS
jgi:hypothetical protein